jgi:hypothetical protein
MIDIVETPAPDKRDPSFLPSDPLEAWSRGYVAGEADAADTIERLRAALELIESVSVHSGGDIHGVNPKAWEAAFMDVQAMARAAIAIVLEEAAKVAQEWHNTHRDAGGLAAAIRGLITDTAA